MKDENIRKLREMRLPAFANAYLAQLEQPDKFSGLTFDERMAVMIDKEYDSRNSNRIKRLLKKSGLPSTKASLGDIAYLPERKLDRDLINRLGTCDFIAKKRNVLVLDEFLLIPAEDAQQRILLELLERRYDRSSTIFCSQFSPEGLA